MAILKKNLGAKKMKKFTLEDLKTIVCEQAQTDPVTVNAETRLAADLGIDSITLVRIISAVSDTYDVTFEDIDFEEVDTLGQAYDTLCQSIAVE